MGGIYTGTNQEYPDAPLDNSLEKGREFLDFVMLNLKALGIYMQPFTSKRYQYDVGESINGIEVKYDSRFTDTGRLSIEIAEKTKASNKDWSPSGIYREDNTWLYVQGNFDHFFIFIKKHLVFLHKTGRYQEGESYGTVKKFYLPIEDAERWGHKVHSSNVSVCQVKRHPE